jgi:hypothetical protein
MRFYKVPTYQYECQNEACGNRFEQVTTIAARRDECRKACKKCRKRKIDLVPAAPSIGDPLKLGVTKLPNSWTDKLKEMKGKHKGSTIKTERTLSK